MNGKNKNPFFLNQINFRYMREAINPSTPFDKIPIPPESRNADAKISICFLKKQKTKKEEKSETQKRLFEI